MVYLLAAQLIAGEEVTQNGVDKLSATKIAANDKGSLTLSTHLKRGQQSKYLLYLPFLITDPVELVSRVFYLPLRSGFS